MPDQQEALMNFGAVSRQMVQSLQLSSPPVALGFLDEAPEGIATFDSAVPSACAFWTRAEKGLFFARADSHENCPIGVFTMGFPISEKVMSNLQEFVKKMCSASYIGAKEPECIPRMVNARRGVLYGPLRMFPIIPDLILIWVNGRQAMLLEEALGAVCWDAVSKAEAFGRPACGALAISANEKKPTLSFGCSGMRTFTDVADDKLLVSLPGSHLQALAQRLQSTVQANEDLLSFYRQHKTQFPAIE
jgi:uncharacterized protein (DUF169 family)